MRPRILTRKKTCPECGTKHRNKEFGDFCGDSCAIEARSHGERDFMNYDRENLGYLGNKLW